MKVKFTQPRCIDGADYPVGTHEVPDSMNEHWFFKACVANGAAIILEAASDAPENGEAKAEAGVVCEAPAETYHEHQARWESKADKEAKQAEAQAAPESTQEEPKAAVSADSSKQSKKKAAKKAAKKG